MSVIRRSPTRTVCSLMPPELIVVGSYRDLSLVSDQERTDSGSDR